MSLFDPDELVRLAGRIEDHAGALRGRGRSLSAAAAQARWQSPAATGFRHRVGGLEHKLRHAAHNLDRAAYELRCHARRVRTVEAAMAATARLERTVVRDAQHVSGHAVGGTVHAAEHAGSWLARQL